MIPTRGGDWYDGGFWQDLYLYEWRAYDEALYATWLYLYKVVGQCNFSLDKLDEYGKTLLTESERDKCKAEVRAIRAMFYYYLMDMFGSGSPYEKTAGARMSKYEVDRSAYSDGHLQSNDIVLFRYADAVLMAAEAKVRNGEDGSAELNAVRRRVGMPERNATLASILDERLLELMWEGWRRQDLIRFGLFHQAYDQRPQLPRETNGYTTVFPIPSRAISLNGNLQQNPGYSAR